MVSKAAPDEAEGKKEPVIYSTRMLSSITADQAGAKELITNVELKQNSDLLVCNEHSSMSPSRGFS